MQSKPHLPGDMLINLTHPVTPEVTFDPELPIVPVTFDLKPEVLVMVKAILTTVVF